MCSDHDDHPSPRPHPAFPQLPRAEDSFEAKEEKGTEQKSTVTSARKEGQKQESKRRGLTKRKMALKPATHCCGCFTLLFGVELICLVHLIECIQTVALTSSVESVRVGGILMDPNTQVMNGAWALLGIPVSVLEF